VTDRNTRAATRSARPVQRVFLPIVLFAFTTVAAGCLQQAGVPNLTSTQLKLAQSAAFQSNASNTLVDDESLSMPALQGTPTAETSAVQVRPNGEVVPAEVESPAVVDAPVTRWVKNDKPITLWSSAGVDATAFTDAPAASFLRVEGPEVLGRLPVYYLGDGLLRQPGDAWVDASAVDTIDAPAPGQVAAVDADAKQPLPVWVQAHTATKLWSGPDEKAVGLTDLSQWTFLKVAGLARDGRILVNYAGDYASRQPGIGWVDSTAVGPAGDPGVWVTNHRASALWSGTDARATLFNDLPQWTKLRIVDGAPADKDRMEVQFFGDTIRQAGVAWIARADIGPITPPVPLPSIPVPVPAAAAKATRAPQTYSFASDTDFITAVGEAARRSQKATGVPASVTVAQAILESDWGRSRLTRQGNNLFGIKALGGSTGSAGVVSMATWEHVDGQDVVVQAPFKAYNTLEDSVTDHGMFFVRNRRYADALAVASDARAFAQTIQDDGYATDPSYATKLVRLMDRYDLYRFDSN
jgi:hypothetical protein